MNPPIHQSVTPTSLARGSEWRKWDLHIHSPKSALNNQFPKLETGEPDWEAYLQKLQEISDVAVFGITDYFSIEGYKRVRQFWLEKRLQNVALILPNIELIITHNPNLVVNTDAQQIIVANFNGFRDPRIMYRSRGLENVASSQTTTGIREEFVKFSRVEPKPFSVESESMPFQIRKIGV